MSKCTTYNRSHGVPKDEYDVHQIHICASLLFVRHYYHRIRLAREAQTRKHPQAMIMHVKLSSPAPPTPAKSRPAISWARLCAVPAMMFPIMNTQSSTIRKVLMSTASCDRFRIAPRFGQTTELTAMRPMIGKTTVVVNRYEVVIHVSDPLVPNSDPMVATEVATIVSSRKNM